VLSWWRIDIGYNWRCGGENYSYVVRAVDEEQAKELVAEVHSPKIRENRDTVEVTELEGNEYVVSLGGEIWTS
jgi:hypothetical protein